MSSMLYRNTSTSVNCVSPLFSCSKEHLQTNWTMYVGALNIEHVHAPVCMASYLTYQCMWINDWAWLCCCWSQEGCSPLFLALQAGHLDVTQELLLGARLDLEIKVPASQAKHNLDVLQIADRAPCTCGNAYARKDFLEQKTLDEDALKQCVLIGLLLACRNTQLWFWVVIPTPKATERNQRRTQNTQEAAAVWSSWKLYQKHQDYPVSTCNRLFTFRIMQWF